MIKEKIITLLLVSFIAFAGCSLVGIGTQSELPPPPDVQPTSTFAPTRGPLGALDVQGRLLYSQGTGGLWELALQSGRQQQLWQPPEGGYVNSVAASPDGTRLALSYAPPSGGQYYTDLYVANADGSDPVPLLEGSDETEIFQAPTWSPDGAWIYFGHIVPQYNSEGDYLGVQLNVERVAPDGSAGPELVIEGGDRPSFSGDGQRLVFLRYQDSTFRGLWAAGADGSGAEELVPAGEFFMIASPRLSPAGATVAFAASGAEEASAAGALPLADLFGVKTAWAHGLPWQIFRVPVTEGTPERMSTMVTDTPSLAWSPDGSRLALMQPGGLFLLDTPDPRFLGPVEDHGALEWTD